ncbi:MAG: hypothetical protein ACYC37_11565 [Desulfobacteria bacterium]
MKMRTTGRAQRIGFAFALSFLACGAANASELERRIPVIRDTAGSGMTMEISREGARQAATPVLTLNNPTVERIEDRIGKMIARLAAKEIPAEATVADSAPRIGPGGTPRDESGRPETSLSSRLTVPEEITVRSVRNFLKGLRASRMEKPGPAVVVAAPEQRLGRADTSRR